LGDLEKINPFLFVASVLDPCYEFDILEFWFLSNVGEGKTNRIFSNLRNVLDQLYSHYTMNVGGSGAKLSNEGRSCTSSTSLGGCSGTSDKVEKYALKDFHSFRARKNLMLARTEIEKYFAEDVETPNETFDILMWWKINSAKCPVLSEIARDVLAILLTTVASNSAFSTGSRVIDPC
jgi:hypothetical protein